VEACVRLTFYGPQGRLQLDVQRLRPVGQGDLLQAFLDLRARLDREGLFAVERKRPLPPFPCHVGLLTSESGAALQDMLQVFRRRWPHLRCHLLPVPVQGPGAGAALAAGLDRLSRWPGLRLDLVILGRGGGSFEDLFCFNDEALVRAIAACPVPVVSAVGHEIDTTLSDLAADLRAATPTAAAELVAPDRRLVMEQVERAGMRLSAALRLKLERDSRRLAAARTHRAMADPLRRLDTARQQVDEAGRRLDRALQGHLNRAGEQLRQASLRLRAALDRGRRLAAQQMESWPRRLGILALRRLRESRAAQEPLARRLEPALRRRLLAAQGATEDAGRRLQRLEAGRLAALAWRLGFARVCDLGGRPVTAAADVAPGQVLELGFADGRARVRVEDPNPEES